MDGKLSTLLALIAPLVLIGCVEPIADKSAAEEIARLRALGYQVSAQANGGQVTVLRYSGPINSSVACGTRGSFRSLAPRIQGAGGTRQDFKLNTYLILNAGADGIVSSNERDGIYVVTKTSRPSAGAQPSSVESITFSPRSSARFPSGLACRAT